MRLGIAAMLSALLVLASCDKEPASAPTPPPVAATPAPALPTPNLDELASINNAITDDSTLLTAYLSPIGAGIVLVDPPDASEKEKLIAALESLQATFDRASLLSTRQLEIFPLRPEMTEANYKALGRHPSSYIPRISGMLLADAARLFDKGDGDAAIGRVAVVVRLAGAMLRQDQEMVRLPAMRLLAQAAMRLAAIAEAKPDAWKATSPAATAAIRDAFNGINTNDPAGQLRGWEASALQLATQVRSEYAVRGGAKKYAEYLRQSGIDESMASSAQSLVPGGSPKGLVGSFVSLVPTKQFADKAEKLSVKEITAALDAAESAIPAVAAALKAEDDAALETALSIVRTDQTQLSRVVLGMAGLIPTSVRAARERIVAAVHALESLPK